MAKKNGNNERLLEIAKILFERSDKDHKLSVAQIQEELKSKGFDSYRTTVTDGIKALNNYGINIKHARSGNAYVYYIDDRHFTLSEIQVLVDCISSAGVFTTTKTNEFVKKFTYFVSDYQKDNIANNYYQDSYLNRDNDFFMDIVKVVNKAIKEKKWIKFKYFRYDITCTTLKRIDEGEADGFDHVIPYKLYWRNGNYYLIGWGNKHGITYYRLDRFKGKPQIDYDRKYVKKIKNPEIKKYIEESFEMMPTKEAKDIELICSNDLGNVIVDKFGLDAFKKAKVHDSQSFSITVHTTPNDIFFGWVFGNKGSVQIVSPKSVKTSYLNMLKSEYDRMI